MKFGELTAGDALVAAPEVVSGTAFDTFLVISIKRCDSHVEMTWLRGDGVICQDSAVDASREIDTTSWRVVKGDR